MENPTRYVRMALTAVGIWTMLLSLRVIIVAGSQLQELEGDGLFDASIVVLLLGVLLSLGGGCLAVCGMKYGRGVGSRTQSTVTPNRLRQGCVGEVESKAGVQERR